MGEQRSRGGATGLVDVRRNNLSVVLSHLRDAGPRSRARVAEETGLNKATISSLVSELIDRGLVAAGDTQRGAVGRPGQTIAVGGHDVLSIGVEINVDYVAALVLDLARNVVAERRLTVDTRQSPDDVLARAAALARNVLRRPASHGATIAGLTLAVPGLVEPATGTLRHAPNLGWHDVPVVANLRHALGDPPYAIALDNEANLAARAELDARGDDLDLILITGAAGVGGGIVSGGRLLRGAHGFGGEVGHIEVDPGGRRCGCGRQGCWETVVGLEALLETAAAADDPVRDPALDVAERLRQLAERAATGDRRTLDACDDVARWLAHGAGVLVNIFDPEVFVLGGYFATLAPWLIPTIEAGLATKSVAPNPQTCRVERSQLGLSAAVRGGALHAMGSVFDDPTVVTR